MDQKVESLGKGSQVVKRLISLDDVFLFEGLTTNLMGMNLLCDQDLCINFNHSEWN